MKRSRTWWPLFSANGPAVFRLRGYDSVGAALAAIRYLPVLLLAACGSEQAPKSGVDRVFTGGSIYTLDDTQPWVEAIAVQDDTIVYVGDSDGAIDLVGENTLLHRLDGEMLLPGFIDTHMHPISGGAYAKALSLETGGTVDEWIAAIDSYAEANSTAPLIFGYGWLSTTFGPEGPRREMIDAVVSDKPVLIMDEGFHGA